jgi:hypothetical protein
MYKYNTVQIQLVYLETSRTCKHRPDSLSVSPFVMFVASITSSRPSGRLMRSGQVRQESLGGTVS